MSQEMTKIVIESIGNYIEGYLAYLFITAVFKKRQLSFYKSLGIVVLYGTIMGIINYVTIEASIVGIIFMVIYWTFIGILLFGNKKSYRYSLVSLMFVAIVMVSELIGILVLTLFGISINEAIENTNYYILTFIFTRMLLFFIISNLNYSRLKKGLVKKLHMMTVGIIFVLNMMVVLLIFDILRLIDPDNTDLLSETALLMVVVIVVNILLYRIVGFLTGYIEREIDHKLKVQHYEHAIDHAKSLKAVSSRLRQERHDYKNHMSAILAMAKSDHIDQIDTYIDTMMVEQDKAIAIKTDSAIEAIIVNKIEKAKKAGVKVSLDLKVPGEGQVKEYDVAAIIGNAMDNAIEACALVKEAAFIDIKTHVKQGYYNISIVNSAIPDVVKKNKRFKTTKSDALSHGYGLSNIRYVVEKNSGLLNLIREEERFVFRCSILLGVK